MLEPPALHRPRPFLIALVVVAVIVIFGVGGVLTIGVPGSSTGAATSPSALGSTETAPTSSTSPSQPVAAGPTPTSVAPTASPTVALAAIPLVPIVDYWSTLRSIPRSELADMVSGVHAPGPNPAQSLRKLPPRDLHNDVISGRMASISGESQPPMT